ncbi:MAG: NPCBM/NEW2 domain-containing protein [Phycisphaerae bacterium]|nr:NPCBM/NEW2 domain-containing protein [Phycisphaerae bacterium]
MNYFRNILRCVLIAVLLSAAATGLHAESAARYEAMFADGARIEGDKVSGWGEHPGSPRLGDTALTDAGSPLRWLLDRTLKPWSPNHREHYIEFVGGDRIVGRIESIGAGDGLYAPPHLVFKPAAPLHQTQHDSPPHVRILPERIERVVFQSNSRRRLQPGTLYRRDGRKEQFVHLRWKKESVVLLLRNGSNEIQTADISEIHLPRIEPWKAYWRELAILSPACRSRIMRIETTGGLIATASSLRFAAAAYDTGSQQQAAAVRIRQSLQKLLKIKNKEKANRLKLDQARARHEKQLRESEEQTKAAGQAHQKALADMRKRIDGLRKTDSARFTKQRNRLDEELRAAEKAMRKQLSKKPADKQDAMLKTFLSKQTQLRQRREKTLEDEKSKLDRQRTRELDRFISSDKRKLQLKIKELQGKTAVTQRQLNEETVRWRSFLVVLESARLQHDSVRSGRHETWAHIIQPVWSLDPLWVPFRRIRMRWSFDPARVPLCRVRPVSEVNPPFLPRRTNRSWVGGLLRSGGRNHAWGFAVHAYSELRFPLPQCASAFRSRVGLDNVVGQGGCARAGIFVGSTKSKPAYASPLLIGTKKTVDTGSVRLTVKPDDPRLLVLQADPADRNGPTGTDPLNIRDKLNWLDPQLELDRAGLENRVRQQVGPLLAACPGWEIQLDQRGGYVWTSFFYEKGRHDQRSFWPMIEAKKQPLRLRRKTMIGPDSRQLAVHLGLPTDIHHSPGTITLHADGRKIPARKIPIRQIWRDRPTPLVFDLEQFNGKKITLELTQPAGGKPLHWQAVSISKLPPPEYHLVDVLKLVGKKDMQVPHELGLALQSEWLSKGEKLAALEINQQGGVVNFRPPMSVKEPSNTLDNVMIGRDWVGGDKTFLGAFATFSKMPKLKSLLVMAESGISDGAVAKLQTKMPKLKISRIIVRVPSLSGGNYRPVTWRNRTKRQLIIMWVTEENKLKFSSTPDLKPGQELKRSAYLGVRYEAHYVRKGFDKAQDYFFSQPISTFHMESANSVWEIKH